MCGIIGIASNKPVSINIINSLKKLEYRGYDSAGIATLTENTINEKKCTGRVEELEKILFKTPANGNIGIGHVRWATHGVPNLINAHPHSSEQVSVVHNGIIENSDEIKKELEAKGVKFKSQTDTEVVTLLITEALKENRPLDSVFKTLKKLKGSFALGIIFKNFSNIIIGARRGSPLAVGYSKEENYIGSDSYALKSMTNKISYLDDGELCVLTKDEVSFYDASLKKINKKILTMSESEDLTDKGEYKHFMFKEIVEQPDTVKNCIDEYVDSLKKKSTRGTSVYTLSDKASDKITARLAERENKVDMIAGVNLEEVDNEVASILLDLTRRDTKNSSSFFAETYIKRARKSGHRLLRRPHRHAGFAVLKSPDIPSVLIELGFLSNSKDVKLLTNKKSRNRLLQTLASSIDKFIKNRTQNF